MITVKTSLRGNTLRGRSYVRDFLFGLRDQLEKRSEASHWGSERDRIEGAMNRISLFVREFLANNPRDVSLTMKQIADSCQIRIVRNDTDSDDFEMLIVESNPHEIDSFQNQRNTSLPFERNNSRVSRPRGERPKRVVSRSSFGNSNRRPTLQEQIARVRKEYASAKTEEEKRNAQMAVNCFEMLFGFNPLKEDDVS